MKRNVTLSIPNEKRFVPLALKAVEETTHLAGLEARAIRDILRAVRELVTNAVMHAYPKGMGGIIDVDIQLQPHGIQISVHDMGMPFNFEHYMASPKEGGLKRLSGWVDELRFANLGKQGKSFTIFKSHPLEFLDESFHPYSDLEDSSPASLKPASIQIRDFQAGDGEAISRLIYNNYTYSYFKPIFYYPKKVREMNERGEIASVVAQTREGKIVGHFALVRVPQSNIAEVGVAVVHPDYKGKGIMNAMLDRIMARAHEMGLSAVFGEALTMHPYSQRANLRHGFGESALVLGLVPATMALTDPNAVQSRKRTAVLVGFKILTQAKERSAFLPKRYRELLEEIYANNGIRSLSPGVRGERERISKVAYELSPYHQTGTLMIERGGGDILHRIRQTLHILYRKHVDMIYADVNLMRCGELDRVVDLLAEEGFVFCGLLPYRRRDEDYLRMQLPNTNNIEMEQIVCFSDFCGRLRGEIVEELARSDGRLDDPAA
jgi:N-acetylglutamate synthase-like GNAT family acetyltransferase/anti-sigma regulatory factor (Ser/Thr protein kinase)